MSTRKSSEHNIRKLAKIGGKSFGVTLPIEIIRSLGWQAKQKVIVSMRGRTLTIKDWPKRNT